MNRFACASASEATGTISTSCASPSNRNGGACHAKHWFATGPMSSHHEPIVDIPATPFHTEGNLQLSFKTGVPETPAMEKLH